MQSESFSSHKEAHGRPLSSNSLTGQDGAQQLDVLFLCGEHSRWGYSHLEPLLLESRFRLTAVVIATQTRWAIFQKALSGQVQNPPGWMVRAKGWLRTLLRRKPLDQTKLVLHTAAEHNVPVLLCDDVNSPQSIELLKSYSADLMFCAAYPQILKPELLSVCPQGAYNSHPSLLPRCRGAHPVFWALASGETQSGATIHVMTPQLDQGDIVAQVKVDILPTDTYIELYAKLVDVIPELVSQFTTRMLSPSSNFMPQIHSRSTCFRNDRLIHRCIFWSEMTAWQIHNLVRACAGQAYFWHQGVKVSVRQVVASDANRNMTNEISVPAGTVVDVCDGQAVVAAQQGFVLLEDVTWPRWKRIYFEVGQVL